MSDRIMVFAERLCVAKALRLVLLCVRGEVGELVLLEPTATGIQRALAALIGRMGVSVRVADFRASRMRTPDGQNPFWKALLFAGREAYGLAREAVAGFPGTDPDGNDAATLFVANAVCLQLHASALRILVAEILSEGRPAKVFVDLGPVVTCIPRGLTVSNNLEIVTCRSGADRVSRLVGLATSLVSLALRRLKGSQARSGGAPAPTVVSESQTQGPCLLMFQEDELGLDPSLRQQPHWYRREDGPLGFQARIVLNGFLPAPDAATGAAMAAEGIRVEPPLARMPSPAWHGPAGALFKDCLRLLACGLLAGGPRGAAAFQLSEIFVRAQKVVQLCQRGQVRAMLFGESYSPDARAGMLAARRLGIPTFGYQYSNLPFASPGMMCATDQFGLFADQYRRIWGRMAPRQHQVLVGYPYDGAFAPLAERTAALRARLRDLGATCILGFFDENTQDDRWGLHGHTDMREELAAVMQAILDDPTLAVIVKSQFMRNIRAETYPDLHRIRLQAEATGRFVVLYAGRHRNIILPSEAALAADVAIGYLVGATASVEAALAGARSLLINPYGIETPCDDLYREADALFPTLSDALEAIRQFRDGDRPGLGDWSAIVHHFDAFRDGASRLRLRKEIDDLMREQPQRVVTEDTVER